MSKIIGKRPPTEKTPGILGQEYIDSTTGKTYVCTHVNYGAVNDEPAGEIEGRYTWEEGSGGGASSWNDLTNKPFGDITIKSDTIEWDGNTEGLLKVALDEFNSFYLISDVVLTIEDMSVGIKCIDDGNMPRNMNVDDILSAYNYNGVITNDYYHFVIVLKDGDTFKTYDGDYVFPKAGIYFNHYKSDFTTTYTKSITIPGVTISETEGVKTIAPKYVKDMYYSEIGRKYLLENEDVSNITSGQMGMCTVTLSKTIDKIVNGKKYSLDYLGNTYIAESVNNAIQFYDVVSPEISDRMTFTFTGGSNNLSVYNGAPNLRNWDGVTISLYTEDEVVHTIPEKYLPQPITFVVDESDNVIVPRPFEEIYTLSKNGYMDFQLDQSVSVSGNLKRLRAIQTMTAGPSSLSIFFVDMAGGSPTIMLNSDGTAKVIYATE